MNLEKRDELFRDFLDTYVFKVSKDKGKEYSRGEEDVNSNFKREAAALDLSAEKVLHVYMNKHYDAVTNACKTGQFTNLSEPIEGRIGDCIVYLLILHSLIHEQKARWTFGKKSVEHMTSDEIIDATNVAHDLPPGTGLTALTDAFLTGEALEPRD